MIREYKIRIIAIFLYTFPILATIIFTKSLDYFLLIVGLMTILLGLGMKFIPNYVGYKKIIDKYNSPIFIIIAGILLIFIFLM